MFVTLNGKVFEGPERNCTTGVLNIVTVSARKGHNQARMSHRNITIKRLREMLDQEGLDSTEFQGGFEGQIERQSKSQATSIKKLPPEQKKSVVEPEEALATTLDVECSMK